jgi:hypothetical protein
MSWSLFPFSNSICSSKHRGSKFFIKIPAHRFTPYKKCHNPLPFWIVEVERKRLEARLVCILKKFVQ